MAAHFDVDMLVGVYKGAMAGGLLDEFAAVGEDECLRGIAGGGDAVDEVSEDDCLAGPGCQRGT